jgi:hypothetical protein
VRDLRLLLLTQSATHGRTSPYIRVHQVMKWDYVLTIHGRVCQVFAYHFQDSSMMGAVSICVPNKKRSQNWNKSSLEQKSEQVLLN